MVFPHLSFSIRLGRLAVLCRSSIGPAAGAA
jgi:hypothetical protein